MKALLREWLLVRRDRAAIAAYAVFAVACAVALATSVASHRRDGELQADLAREEAARIASLRAEMTSRTGGAGEAWADPASPGAVGRGRAGTYAMLPERPLGVLRGVDVAPRAVLVTTRAGALDAGERDVVNARIESVGRFDLALLFVVLFPLTIVLLCFDVVARERETGTLRLLLVEGGRVGRLFVLRCVCRAGPVVLLALVTLAASVAITSGVDARALAVAATALVLYAVFWIAVTLALSSWFATSTANGLATIGTWIAFVVFAPTALAATVDRYAPTPSRIERTSAVREATRLASQQGSSLLARYYEDHPELAPDGGPRKDDFFARQVAVAKQVAAARAPVEARYFQALSRQRALVRTFSLASPVVLADRVLADLSGASRERTDSFREQVDAFQAELAGFFDDKTLRGQRLSLTSLDERPRFHFREPKDDATTSLLALAAWTAAAMLLATRRAPHASSLERTTTC
ncbi:MAG: ABC transporter permease subunit [Labilithrix sp.]|nr:ABC transporter permease subunit [Labilithrix sp.]MCW5817451.1 ABC transporter permease subunit [Labilithrix sp.]